MSRLANKTAVITGASSGIGRAIALAYTREGAQVVINYNCSGEAAQALAEEINSMGGKAYVIQADVADSGQVERLVTEANRQLGRIDIWVNNAGADILTGAGSALSDTEKLDLLLSVDLKGTISCCWSVLPALQQQGGGTIINMSWDLAVHGLSGINPQIFAAVKAGILGFSKSLAATHAPAVRVNVLAPGWIETAFAAEFMEREYYQSRLDEIPMKRFGMTEDVAQAAVFLASDESAYITGEVIKINGGLI